MSDTEIVQAYVHGTHDLLRSEDKGSPQLREWWAELGPGEIMVVTGPATATRYPDEETFLIDYEWIGDSTPA